MIRIFMVFYLILMGMMSCRQETGHMTMEERFAKAREQMVEKQIKARGVRDRRVLEAMRKVPRHRFVKKEYWPEAYADEPLPIGYGQTISQPYIVAYMTEQLQLKGDEKVLEIGTGSGYQAAILAELAKDVYTIEIIPELAHHADSVLQSLGYQNVHVRVGDGYLGWPEAAPFDAIIVTAAPEQIPSPLLEQLKVGGRMIIPLGDFYQDLVLVVKTEKGIRKERKIPVRFVPMTGKAQEKHPPQ